MPQVTVGAAGIPQMSASCPTVAPAAYTYHACRQQVPAALSVTQAGITSSGSSKGQHSHSTTGIHSSGLPRCFDILLMRVKAQLLLAIADANGALAVLGSAKQRLSTARRGLAERQDAAAAVAVLKQQEAQVSGFLIAGKRRTHFIAAMHCELIASYVAPGLPVLALLSQELSLAAVQPVDINTVASRHFELHPWGLQPSVGQLKAAQNLP